MKLRIHIAIAVMMVMACSVKGQDTTHMPPNPPQKRFTPLPLVPRFPGGRDSLAMYIKTHTKCPRCVHKHHTSAVIEVDFVVAKDGSLKNIHVLKPLCKACDKEAIRVVKGMPKWQPGMMGRNPIEMDYHVDIPFGTQTPEQTHP